MKSNSDSQDRSLLLADMYGASVHTNADVHGMPLKDAATKLIAEYQERLAVDKIRLDHVVVQHRIDALQKIVDSFAGK